MKEMSTNVCVEHEQLVGKHKTVRALILLSWLEFRSFHITTGSRGAKFDFRVSMYT